MRRKAVIKTQPARKTTAGVSQLAGKGHFHFCANARCRLIYEDFCDTPETNRTCPPCRGIRRAVWMQSRDPRECCTSNCRQVTNPDDLIRYQLAGPGPWFKCQTCARCHGWPCT